MWPKAIHTWVGWVWLVRLANFTTAVCVVTVELELVRIVGPMMSVLSRKVMKIWHSSLMCRGAANARAQHGHSMFVRTSVQMQKQLGAYSNF